MTQDDFARREIWGLVNLGTIIADSSGERYIVERQDEAGFLSIQSLADDDKHQEFEALDQIDHTQFRTAS
jgi:hypothetical protein